MMRLVPTGVRQALRRLATTPLLSVGAILILSLGIGSAVVMADVLDRLLLRAPPHVTDPDRVARIYIGVEGQPYSERVGYSMAEALASLKDELEASAVFVAEELSLGRGEGARRLDTIAHSPGYFDALGVGPVIGSLASIRSGREDVAVISHSLWQQQFGGSRDIVGRSIRLGTETYTIVAVTPRSFAGIGQKPADVWLPLVPRASNAYGEQWKEQSFFLQAIARLRLGVNRERANEHATAAYRALQANDWRRRSDVVLGDLRPARAPGTPVGTRVEVLVAGVSILVLLLTCGNVANLMLIRGLRRSREFVVKTALGASRARLWREVLLEGTLLAAAAGIVALAVVVTAGTLMRRLFLSPLTALASPLDGRLVAATVAFCVAAAFLLGVTPAFRLTTRRALRPGHAAVGRGSRLLDVFSGLQVALSLPMMAAAGLFVLSLWNASHQDFGMQTDRVAVVTTNLFEVGRPMENHVAHRRMQARLAPLPQVRSTAVIQNLPMQSSMFFILEVPGKDLWKGTVTSAEVPAFNAVDPSFFTLMRMRLVQGRFFNDGENREGARSVAVITESMARSIWPGEPAVGKCFYMGGKGEKNPCTEVVGVAADARLFPSIRPTKQWASAFYLPIEQNGKGASSRALLVETAGDPAGVLGILRREAQVAASDLPYVEVYAFDDVFQGLLRPWRLGSAVFVAFGALSMLIAAVGLIVVGTYGVTWRTREIGIRSALGAEPGQLVELVLGRSLIVVVGGVVAGVGLAYVTGRLLHAQLFDVKGSDPRVLATAVLGLLVVGGVAAWLPARRAARIDPVIALRAE